MGSDRRTWSRLPYVSALSLATAWISVAFLPGSASATAAPLPAVALQVTNTINTAPPNTSPCSMKTEFKYTAEHAIGTWSIDLRCYPKSHVASVDVVVSIIRCAVGEPCTLERRQMVCKSGTCSIPVKIFHPSTERGEYSVRGRFTSRQRPGIKGSGRVDGRCVTIDGRSLGCGFP